MKSVDAEQALKVLWDGYTYYEIPKIDTEKLNKTLDAIKLEHHKLACSLLRAAKNAKGID